jgi:RHS repeat-associated protein
MWYTLDCLAAARTGYLHSDHLGSTSLTTDQSGAPVAETRYLPYGEERWTNEAQPTDFTFTGERAERGFALMDYNARYYDPYLNRFISADTVVPNPGESKDLNRYAYAGNNPVRYTDPTGHYLFEEEPDDPFIWRQDKPADTNTLIRSVEPVVFWEETRTPIPVHQTQDFPSSHHGGRLDGIGWRLDVSGGQGLASDANLDLVWNWRSGEVAPFLTIGPQGLTAGGAASTGLLLISNMVDLGAYEGESYHAGLTGAQGYGAEVDFSSSAQYYKGEIPVVAYVAPAFGNEISIYGGYGRTIRIVLPHDVLKDFASKDFANKDFANKDFANKDFTSKRFH